jgi:hypothetical protein
MDSVAIMAIAIVAVLVLWIISVVIGEIMSDANVSTQTHI